MLPATTVSLVTDSRIYDTLIHLATDNNLIFTDMNHLSIISVPVMCLLTAMTLGLGCLGSIMCCVVPV